MIHYNFQLTTINNSIMLAMKYSILAILLSLLFHHSAERSFPMFGPFVIITAIFNRLYINNTNKYFERSYK